MTYTYRTGIAFTLSDSMGADQHHVDLTLRYTVSKGREPTLEEPGEGPSVNIQDAKVVYGAGLQKRPEQAPDWLWTFIESDGELEREMLANAADDDEYRRDQAADAIREEEANR